LAGYSPTPVAAEPEAQDPHRDRLLARLLQDLDRLPARARLRETSASAAAAKKDDHELQQSETLQPNRLGARRLPK
jgi:hypothetical protein